MAAASQLNLEFFGQMLGENKNLMREVSEIFLKTQADTMQRMEAAVKQRSNKEISYTAHKMASPLATFGATQALDCAKQLELRANDDTLKNPDELYASLARAVEQLCAELTEFLALKSA